LKTEVYITVSPAKDKNIKNFKIWFLRKVKIPHIRFLRIACLHHWRKIGVPVWWNIYNKYIGLKSCIKIEIVSNQKEKAQNRNKLQKKKINNDKFDKTKHSEEITE